MEAASARWGQGTRGKIGVGNGDGIPNRGWGSRQDSSQKWAFRQEMVFQTSDGVPNRGRALVLGWDTRQGMRFQTGDGGVPDRGGFVADKWM